MFGHIGSTSRVMKVPDLSHLMDPFIYVFTLVKLFAVSLSCPAENVARLAKISSFGRNYFVLGAFIWVVPESLNDLCAILFKNRPKFTLTRPKL
jgi:hypothetical protein